MIWRTKRKARRTYRCDCGEVIRPGDTYLDLVASPHHEDLGNTFWWRIKSCYDCAVMRNTWEE